MNSVATLTEFDSLLKNEQAVLFYFSHDHCSVCKVLKPKIENELQPSFPLLKMLYCDIQKYPELSAQNNVYIAPTILICFNGNETFRLNRHTSIHQLIDLIGRPYRLLFS
jgi:thioredoxin 1